MDCIHLVKLVWLVWWRSANIWKDMFVKCWKLYCLINSIPTPLFLFFRLFCACPIFSFLIHRTQKISIFGKLCSSDLFQGRVFETTWSEKILCFCSGLRIRVFRKLQKTENTFAKGIRWFKLVANTITCLHLSVPCNLVTGVYQIEFDTIHFF